MLALIDIEDVIYASSIWVSTLAHYLYIPNTKKEPSNMLHSRSICAAIRVTSTHAVGIRRAHVQRSSSSSQFTYVTFRILLVGWRP